MTSHGLRCFIFLFLSILYDPLQNFFSFSKMTLPFFSFTLQGYCAPNTSFSRSTNLTSTNRHRQRYSTIAINLAGSLNKPNTGPLSTPFPNFSSFSSRSHSRRRSSGPHRPFPVAFALHVGSGHQLMSGTRTEMISTCMKLFEMLKRLILRHFPTPVRSLRSPLPPPRH